MEGNGSWQNLLLWHAGILSLFHPSLLGIHMGTLTHRPHQWPHCSASKSLGNLRGHPTSPDNVSGKHSQDIFAAFSQHENEQKWHEKLINDMVKLSWICHLRLYLVHVGWIESLFCNQRVSIGSFTRFTFWGLEYMFKKNASCFRNNRARERDRNVELPRFVKPNQFHLGSTICWRSNSASFGQLPYLLRLSICAVRGPLQNLSKGKH